MSARFTIDGSEQLESRLSLLCETISHSIQKIVSRSKLEAIVLGGGYGRGEGGVLRAIEGDQPYNDIEFYVFIAGSPLLNSRRYRAPLEQLAEELSKSIGIHVEFKVDSIRKLRKDEVSMFSYDLLSAHRVVLGEEAVFSGCEHHLDSSAIPISEATRLLLNRGTGLLLAREILEQGDLSAAQSDFIGRNLAKAKLALGDALLTGLGEYHWSCRERHLRLCSVLRGAHATLPFSGFTLENILGHHSSGVRFKLHPAGFTKSAQEFLREHDDLAALALEIWLWVESRRRNRPISSLRDCVLNHSAASGSAFSWRNYVLNARTFGLAALFDPMSRFYPRERLLCSLPLLLRKSELSDGTVVREHLQKQLRTSATDWPGLVSAYKQIWPGYA